MYEQLIILLSEELKKPLPGIEAQLRLSPPVRYRAEPNQPARKSAVMIVLYPINDRIHTVFIKRTEYNGVHSGQVSLPGGMQKDSDESILHTALRETTEETGIDSNTIHVIGHLTPLHIPVSNTQVSPFIGFCKTRPQFRPDSFEVKYLIESGIYELMNPANQKKKLMKIGDNEVEIPYFDIHGDHIWGATAMIISEFLEISGRLKS